MTTPAFRSWIDSLPRWRGWVQLSPERPYAHAEEQYDDQYGVTEASPEDGQGLCALLQQHGVDVFGPALEIGCGTGRLTFGLARHYPGPDFLITDPSPAFLRITQSQLGSGAGCATQLHYAVLNADDVGQLPAGMFSLIAMRSTLHHILNVDDFIAACARLLRPGGALAMGAEPVESGYLLMGVIGQSILPVLESAGIVIQPAWRKQVQSLTDTVKFYCQRGIKKETAEDKHLFTPHEMADFGAKHGLQLHFSPNAAFADYVEPFAPEFEGFSGFFLNYLQYCMLFDAEFLEHIRRQLKPQLRYIDECYSSHAGPAVTGVFLLKKTSSLPAP